MFDQVFYVTRNRLPGVEAITQLIRRVFEIPNSVIDVVFACRLIVATLAKSIRET